MGEASLQLGLELEGRGKYREACLAFEEAAKAEGPAWSRAILRQRERECLRDLDYWDDIAGTLCGEDVVWRVETLAMKNDYE